MKAVEDNIHSPHRWQPNTGTFTTSSKKSIKHENFFSRGDIGDFPDVTKSNII
jgi:hypothetical protein